MIKLILLFVSIAICSPLNHLECTAIYNNSVLNIKNFRGTGITIGELDSLQVLVELFYPSKNVTERFRIGKDDRREQKRDSPMAIWNLMTPAKKDGNAYTFYDTGMNADENMVSIVTPSVHSVQHSPSEWQVVTEPLQYHIQLGDSHLKNYGVSISYTGDSPDARITGGYCFPFDPK